VTLSWKRPHGRFHGMINFRLINLGILEFF
jgi:hypothetical protein